MAEAQLRSLLRHLHRCAAGPGAELTDGQLLERFCRQRDEGAFEALVRRHGPMVLGVCRRVLRREHDAEDAFQATFLALVRKAASIGRRESVGAWLYKVGYRVALAANTRAARERSGKDLAGAEARPEAGDAELRQAIDEEVSLLPDRYRLPFVLCCVQGRTIAEAARELGCPCGTVGTRLARARQRLRTRLARRGLAPSVAMLAFSLAVPQALAAHTVRAAVALAVGKVAGVMVTPVAVLTEGVLRAMLVSKVKMAAVLLAVALAGTGAGALSYRAWAVEGPDVPPSTEDRAAAEKELRAAEKELDRVQARLDKVRTALETDSNGELPGLVPADQRHHDFGTVPRGTRLSHRFTLKNAGKVPVKIDAVRTSCGCVTAVVGAAFLGPGQTGFLDVTVDARRFVGRKTVTVHVQMGGDALLLRVSAESRADLVLDPGQLDFGIIPQGQGPTKTLTVDYAGHLDWRVRPVARDGSPLEVKVEESYRGPGQVGYRVSVTLRTDTPPGPLPQEVRLKTNDPVTPLISIPVVGTVQPPLTAAPADLHFGNLRVGDQVERKLMVRCSKPFKILAIEGLGENLRADWPAEASPMHIVQIRFKPTRAGVEKGVLRIRTDLDTSAEISITVEATAAPEDIPAETFHRPHAARPRTP
jgi:RNA polymerase sigma factor (sigma-70 family)